MPLIIHLFPVSYNLQFLLNCEFTSLFLDDMNLQPRINYGAQFAILLGITGAAFIVGGVATIFISAAILHTDIVSVSTVLLKPEHATLAQWVNTGFSFIAFFVPTIITAAIASNKPFAYTYFNKKANIKQIATVIILGFFGLMLSGLLGELTEKIPLSPILLKKAKALEDTYDEAVAAMITMKSFKDYLIALLVIAIAPAIFEETLFRGGLQRILTGWTKSPWFSIILTAIFFSLVHISYFGFLSRFALGMLLGFIFYYSGNIWLNILLHFLNNGAAVTQLYILVRSGKPMDKAMNENLPGIGTNTITILVVTIVVLVIIIALFKRFKRESEKVNPVATQILPVINNNPFANE